MNTKAEKAVAGKEAEKFLNGKVGRFIIEKAENERRIAIEKFARADVLDTGLIQKIQNDMVTSAKVVNWIIDAISEGKACEYELNQEQSALSSDMPQ